MRQRFLSKFQRTDLCQYPSLFSFFSQRTGTSLSPSKKGCNVRDIETENGQAQYMAVVIDDSSFSSRTTYYELELFGKFTDRKTIDCLPNFNKSPEEKLI